MLKHKTKKSMIHPAFPGEGTVQPTHMGSQSMVPNSPTTPEMMAPQMPSDLSTQMQQSGEY